MIVGGIVLVEWNLEVCEWLELLCVTPGTWKCVERRKQEKKKQGRKEITVNCTAIDIKLNQIIIQ